MFLFPLILQPFLTPLLSPLPSPELLTPHVLIVGSGISGLFCALKLADQGKNVLIVTKNALTENNSRYAQGGIAAVLPENTEDSLAAHLQDTLIAGAGLCTPERVNTILQDGHLAIADLLLLGVPFDRDIQGNLSLTLEGGHQARRILHAGGDATGKQVELTLTQHVEHHPNIQVMAYTQVTQLWVEQNRCVGGHTLHTQTGQQHSIIAGATILATGGAGRLFTQTTNPAGATGNGFVLAAQAGATLVDMEFVQFHPTGFVHAGQTQFLLSEALRGEGGVLRNGLGEPLMENRHPLGDLAPRDIVARAIHQCLHEDNTGPVTLDMTAFEAEFLETRFPTLVAACRQFGIEMANTPLPVSPAAHYMMGGVHVDNHGTTGVPGLYAIGETVWTGLHGANRLASNSLLECVVIARNVATLLAAQPVETLLPANPEALSARKLSEMPPYQWSSTCPQPLIELQEIFRQQMTRHAGIMRTEGGLTELQQWLTACQTTLTRNHWARLAPYGVDFAQQLQLAQWLVQAALTRTESRGAHYRADYPETEQQPRHQQMELDKHGMPHWRFCPTPQGKNANEIMAGRL